MFRNSKLNKICRSFICIALGVIVLFPAFKNNSFASNYSDTVGISEDAYQTLLKGTTKYNGVDYAEDPNDPSRNYNPLYYFLNYADLRAAYGANPEELVKHWALLGKNKEHRIANQLLDRGAQAYSSKNEYVVPSYQKTKTKKDGMVVIPNEIHSNGGMNRRQEIEARSIASQLAQEIFDQVSENGGGTQIEMVAYANGIVRAYCDAGTYTTEGKLYRTAYGVFVAHEYSCAGSTRALGLILDYLDQIMTDITNDPEDERTYPPLKWVHVNANTWNDQWCQIVCDNHEAYADPITAQSGYGKHPSAGGKKQDVRSYYSYANENDVVNTRPPLVDGPTTGYKITENKPKNSNSMSGQTDSYYNKYNKK